MQAAAVAILTIVAIAAAQPSQQSAARWLSTSTRVADGVDYFTSTDRSLLDPAGPVAVFLLRLDPARVHLSSVHANDEIMGLESVDSIARRHRAIAAVNGGFFNGSNGDPQFVLKQDGVLVSDARVIKGAVIIRSTPFARTQLEFDQLNAQVQVKFSAAGREWLMPIAGLNTTRARGKLMLYNARYHADTDTAPNGVEWAISGRPLRVTDIRRNAGRTVIPRDGSVLSYGGLDLPEPLAALAVGTLVRFEVVWTSINGLVPHRFDTADDIVAGAGLLRIKGRVPTNWQQLESLSAQYFINMRQPRTMIGVDARGAIWLAAIDGRQPGRSLGMTFAELEMLCDRLQLTDALNLDGGGSTTMFVKDRVVNIPSDLLGPRPVSDALLVTRR